MSTQTFKINGMTCGSCVQKITEHLKNLTQVLSVNVSLAEKKVDLVSDRSISLKEVQTALADMAKYSVAYYDDPSLESSSTMGIPEKKSLFVTYKPLIVVFAYVFIFSIAFQIYVGAFSQHHFMNHLMAGFFIGLSFFKFLNLKAFAESFSNYDPIAKRIKSYGLVYPFIELGLGFLYVANKSLNFANIVTMIILGFTTLGVYQKLKSKTHFQCACLGTGFNLPLSNVTIFENVAMIIMASYGLLRAG